jgi:hypothetical protein
VDVGDDRFFSSAAAEALLFVEILPRCRITIVEALIRSASYDWKAVKESDL